MLKIICYPFLSLIRLTTRGLRVSAYLPEQSYIRKPIFPSARRAIEKIAGLFFFHPERFILLLFIKPFLLFLCSLSFLLLICLFIKRSKWELEGSLVSLFWLLLSLKNELLSLVISFTRLLFEILFKGFMLARASFLFHPRKWRRKVLSDYLIIKILKAMIASWRSTFLAKLSILLFIIWRILGIDSLKLRIDIIESYFIDIPWLCCTTSHFIAAKFKDQICKLCILNNFWEYKRFYWFHSYSSSFFPA